MKRLILLMLSLGMVVNMNSCQNAQVAIPVPSDATDEGTATDGFARVLASSLKSSELRKLLKDEALKQFDGDYNILVTKFLQLNSGTGTTVKQTLARNPELENLITAIESKHQLMNIAVPHYIDKWNTNSMTPLVVVNTRSTNELKLKAYRVDGSEVWLDRDKPTQEPVIVISRSERVELKGNTYQIKRFLDPNLAVNDFKNTSNPSARSAACRQYGQTEKLYQYWVDIPRVESFFDGRPELSLQIFFQPDQFISAANFSPPRSDSQVWLTANTNLFTWNSASPTVLYVWRESDGGTAGGWNITGNGFNVTLPSGAGDVFNHTFISVNDCGYEYNLGWVAMRVSP